MTFLMFLSPVIQKSKGGLLAIRTTNYYQHKDLKSKGVATEFYRRFEIYGKSIGCTYIIGNNDIFNGSRDFFVQKTGRFSVPDFIDKKVLQDFGLLGRGPEWTIKKL